MKIYIIEDANQGRMVTTYLTKVREVLAALAENYGDDYVDNGSVTVESQWLDRWQ